MDDKTKLYIFEKKEVFLIFSLMLLISIISFLFGLKMGHEKILVSSGVTKEDLARVEDLASKREEEVKEVLKKMENTPVETKDDKDALDLDVKNRLEKEFEKELSDENEKFNVVDSETAEKSPESSSDALSGKYTVQLASFRSFEDAQEFAAGFKFRGYNPIINKVETKEKGTRFRVSIGTFNTLTEAKNYILKEKTLVQGYDYIIAQFD